MGFYIDPEHVTKEQWALAWCTKAKKCNSVNEVPEGMALLCYVDNGGFSALGVITSERERKAWLMPGDLRPKVFLFAKKEEVFKVAGLTQKDFSY